MPRILSCLLAACLTAASAQAQAPAKQASTTTETGAKVDDVIQAMRLDLQSARADILAKNMTLTADQAAKFWPVFNAYQKEQNEIIEAQLPHGAVAPQPGTDVALGFRQLRVFPAPST